MIKGLFFARRKPGLSPREFHEYWRTSHADITRALTHIRHYIQSHTLLSSYGNAEMPYWRSCMVFLLYTAGKQ